MKLILVSLLVLALSACSGCAGFTTHQKVAVACESAASSLDAITAAKTAGKIKNTDLVHAIAVYNRTVPFCQPVAQNLDAVKMAALTSAVAELTALAGAAK